MKKSRYFYAIIIFYFALNAFGHYLLVSNKANNLIGFPMFILYLSINIYFIWKATKNNSLFIFVLCLQWLVTLLHLYGACLPLYWMNYVFSLANITSIGWWVFNLPKRLTYFNEMSLIYVIRTLICIIFIFCTTICTIKVYLCRKRLSKLHVLRPTFLYGVIIFYFALNAFGAYLLASFKANIFFGLPMFILYLVINIYFIWNTTKNQNYLIIVLVLQWIINLIHLYDACLQVDLKRYITYITNVVGIGWGVFNLPMPFPFFNGLLLIDVIRTFICILFILCTSICTIKVCLHRKPDV